MPHNNDWRLTNQMSYLYGKKLVYLPYISYRAGWEHEHCEFCSEKIDVNSSNSYCTPDKYYWVCSTCFKDFNQMFKWVITMPEDEYDNNFISIDDFVDCINRGAEVEFLYENKNYSITHAGKKIAVAEYYNGESEKRYKNPIDALQYPIGEKCLGGILGDIKIIFRSL